MFVELHRRQRRRVQAEVQYINRVPLLLQLYEHAPRSDLGRVLDSADRRFLDEHWEHRYDYRRRIEQLQVRIEELELQLEENRPAYAVPFPDL